MTAEDLAKANEQLRLELDGWKAIELRVDATKLDAERMRRTLIAALHKLDKNGLLKKR